MVTASSEALVACPLFRGKQREEIELLLESITYTVTAYSRQALILAEGEPADRIGIVLAGKVMVQKTHATGSGVTIAHLSAGQTIGEAVIFAHNQTIPATVTAATECSLMFISRSELLKLLTADSALLASFVGNLSERLVLVNRKIELLSAGSLRRRIAASLLQQADKQQSAELLMPLNRAEWAEHLNAARPSLSRELRWLQDKGWIDYKGRSVTLLDREAIEAFLLGEDS